MTEIVNPRAILAGIRQAIDDMMEGGDIHVTTAGVRIDLRGLLGDCDVLRRYVLSQEDWEFFKQERDKLLKKALTSVGWEGRLSVELGKHIRDRIEHGTADPEINAIRESVKKAIREGTKGTMGVSEPIQMTLRGDLSTAEQLRRIHVVCAHTGKHLDCVLASRIVRWSCPCGFRYEKAADELPMLPDEIFIDESCPEKGRHKEWP